MITVIIPTLNEENTIGNLVRFAFNSAGVSEVIVVDDKSQDNTIREARSQGAKVLTSSKLGKEDSMKDGILSARNDIIVFLDADITTYPDNIIRILADPILNDSRDLVKSCFSRQAGRVSELVAKPLLSVLLPGFPVFWQPLTGMLAGKKEYLMKIEIDPGYGSLIGILIDMFRMGARIEEVSVGHMHGKSQPMEKLGRMSREVATTIMKKSQGLDSQNLENFDNIQLIQKQMDIAVKEGLQSLRKIALFDLDYCILKRGFIEAAAEKFGFTSEASEIMLRNSNPLIKTKKLALLLKGRSIAELNHVIESIEIFPDLKLAVNKFKQKGYITGVISKEFDCVTNFFKNEHAFDFSISNELEFFQSKATGEVKIPSMFLNSDQSLCKHEYCKLNALISSGKAFGVEMKNTFVIGNSDEEDCALLACGIGFSFGSRHHNSDHINYHILEEPGYIQVLPFIK